MRTKLIASILLLGLLVLVIGIVGCGKPPEISRNPSIYGISIYPSSATIMVGASHRFTAVGNCDDGSTKEVQATWSIAEGLGSIDESGVFTASTKEGNVKVKATSDNISNTAQIIITAATVESIIIIPQILTIEANTEFIEFLAKGKDAFGNEIYISPDWSFDNSDVGSLPSYRLPYLYAKAPGTGHLTAKYLNVSGSAEITVTADVTPPPVPQSLIATPEYRAVNLHWDKLDWTGNNSKYKDFKQYNIYRSTTRGSGYEIIGCRTWEEFKDENSTNGITYYYVVTSVDNNNNESGHSNEKNSVPGSTAKTIYVDGSNSGFENGSCENPFNTISEAVNYARNGDTISVEVGTYNENLSISKCLYLLGSGKGRSVIRCQDTNKDVIEFRNVGNGQISGFTISGARDTSYEPYYHYGLKIDHSTVEVSNNEFKENYCRNDIYVDYGHGLRILNNEFPYESYYPVTPPMKIQNSLNILLKNNFSRRCGIDIDGGQNIEIISNNIVDMQISNAQNVFIMKNYLLDGWIKISSGSSGVKILNNIITGNGNYGTYTEGINVSITNNVIDNIHGGDFGLSGIRVAGGSAQILNNIITNICDSFSGDRWGYGISVGNGANVQIGHNNVWNNYLNYSGCSAGGGDISSNPTFVGLTDYHLSTGSPCINAGNPDLNFNDLDGTRNDMGAYGGPDPYNM